jgi:anti-sigma factor RsiW
MKSSRLEALLQAYIDARLTPDERAELEAELLRSVEARRRFWDEMRFEGQLQEVVEVQQVRGWLTNGERETRARGLSPATPGHRWRWLAAGIAAAVLLAVLLRSPWREEPAEETSSGVAILTASIGVAWADGQPEPEPGDIVPPGPLRLSAGLVGLEFYGGARVTIEGPAEVELRAFDELFCRRGKLRVQVSDRARGFKVTSPRLDVVDLGTEFGLEIDGRSRAELHVFAGKVEVAQVRGTSSPGQRELTTGQGLRLDDRGVQAIPVQPARFAGQDELNARLAEQTRSRHAAWREASEALRRDPRLILYYDFEPASREERVLVNRSSPSGESLDGSIVGARWCEGRWAGKAALEFRDAGDRVRTLVPGEHDTLTLVAWLRADAFETMYSGILLTDGFVKGAVHWQFCNGRIRLGVGGERKVRGRIGLEYDAGSVEPASLLGRWRQVVVVIDNGRREIVHYVDGRVVQRTPISQPTRMKLGPAELGNWGLYDNSGSAPIRNFRGRMDEFLVFNQALTDAEIAQLYEQGRPWPAGFASATR